MKRVLLALVLVGCGSSTKKPDGPPTPTERELPPDASVTPDATPIEPVTAADLEVLPKPASSKRPSQAQIAWESSQAGIEHVKQGNFEEATAKFRDAAARMPEPAYFFNMCLALYQQGHYSEALVACDAVQNNSPTPELAAKTKNMRARIATAAKSQDIKLE